MEKLTKALCVFVLTISLGLTNPAVSQSTDNDATTSQAANNDDDNGKWGLAGLLGLLGLLGLKGRDRDDRRTNTNR